MTTTTITLSPKRSRNHDVNELSRTLAGDPEALFHLNSDMVRWCIRPYNRLCPIEEEDLLQIAYLGLWQAIAKWDPSGPASLQTYASIMIRWKIFKEIDLEMKQRRPWRYASIYARRKVRRGEQLTERLKTPKTKYRKSERQLAVVPEKPIEGVIRNEERELMHARIPKLPDLCREVIRLALKGWDDQQIADHRGTVKTRANQLRNEAIERLQSRYMRNPQRYKRRAPKRRAKAG